MRIVKRDIAGGFIFSADDKLLLGKSYKGGVYADHWVIPGGGFEANETGREALIREILEETGLDIAAAMIEELEHGGSGTSEKTLRDTGERVLVEMQFYNFLVRLPHSAEAIVLQTEDDFVEAYWAEQSELANLKLSPPTVATLKKIGYL